MTSVVPNEELRALVLQMYAMWEARDIDGWIDLFSRHPALLVAGTDPDEYLTGDDAVNVIAAAGRMMPTWVVRNSNPRAHSSGDVGWVSDEPEISIGAVLRFRARITATFVVEQGHWRIIQHHFSVPQRAADVLPKWITQFPPTRIDQVEHRVRDNQSDVTPASAPDGTVTVVFTDIESSATLLDRLGDVEFMRLLAWHDRIVRDTAGEHHGFVVKSEGDGFMLAFPSAAGALRTCLAINDRVALGYRDLPIRVRAGLHCGEALRRGDDFYGLTVVVASRISSIALGGEILVSGVVHTLTQGLGTFTFGEPRNVTLKGLDGSFDIYPLLG